MGTLMLAERMYLRVACKPQSIQLLLFPPKVQSHGGQVSLYLNPALSAIKMFYILSRNYACVEVHKGKFR